MSITLTQLIIWVIIAALVGFVGELHFHIAGEPSLGGVPLISSIIAAAILVAIWSGFAYHRYYRPYASRYYYRRGTYSRRPRRRWW